MDGTGLIGLDWGTSALRAYLFAPDGRVTDTRLAAAGIQAVEGGKFRETFESTCADWIARAPNLAVIASGMIGSRQGWREAPYVPTPAGFGELAGAMLSIDGEAGRTMRIVPGVSTVSACGAHDVMRGEETQVFGALAALGADDATVVLPGTHSKWVRVRAGRLVAFRTYLTGELFAVLSRHSILGRLFAEAPAAPAAATDDAAFGDGLARALADPAAITSLLFSVRAEGLFGRYDANELPSYLSGLLIGAEVAHAISDDALRGAPNETIALVGTDQLVERYSVALERAGRGAVVAPGIAAANGLFALACAAGIAATAHTRERSG